MNTTRCCPLGSRAVSKSQKLRIAEEISVYVSSLIDYPLINCPTCENRSTVKSDGAPSPEEKCEKEAKDSGRTEG
jgi:hypothetical protein